MRYWLLGLLVSACGGSSGSPSAEVTAATPDSIAPADDTRDDLTITVRYDDGDGDLGTGIAEVHDCRGDDLVTALAIPAIAPSSIEGDERITGTLELHVNDIGAVTASAALPEVCADLGVAELAGAETVFCVVLVDAAGHHGDGDCTPVIALE